MTHRSLDGVVAESVLSVAARYCLDKAAFQRSLREDDSTLSTTGTHGPMASGYLDLVDASQNRDVGAFEQLVQSYGSQASPT